MYRFKGNYVGGIKQIRHLPVAKYEYILFEIKSYTLVLLRTGFEQVLKKLYFPEY